MIPLRSDSKEVKIMNRDYNRSYELEPTETELYHQRMIAVLEDIASDIHFFRMLVQIILIIGLVLLIMGLGTAIWMYFRFTTELGI